MTQCCTHTKRKAHCQPQPISLRSAQHSHTAERFRHRRDQAQPGALFSFFFSRSSSASPSCTCAPPPPAASHSPCSCLERGNQGREVAGQGGHTTLCRDSAIVRKLNCLPSLAWPPALDSLCPSPDLQLLFDWFPRPPAQSHTHPPTHPPGSILTSVERLPMPVTILYCFKKSLKSNLAAGWRGSARGQKVGLQRLCKGGSTAHVRQPMPMHAHCASALTCRPDRQLLCLCNTAAAPQQPAARTRHHPR